MSSNVHEITGSQKGITSFAVLPAYKKTQLPSAAPGNVIWNCVSGVADVLPSDQDMRVWSIPEHPPSLSLITLPEKGVKSVLILVTSSYILRGSTAVGSWRTRSFMNEVLGTDPRHCQSLYQYFDIWDWVDGNQELRNNHSNTNDPHI